MKACRSAGEVPCERPEGYRRRATIDGEPRHQQVRHPHEVGPSR